MRWIFFLYLATLLYGSVQRRELKFGTELVNMTTVGSIEKFDAENQSWEEFRERMDLFFEANVITDLNRQKAILLTAIGASTYGLIRSLLSPVEPKDKTYQELVTLLNKHFDPKPSEMVQRCQFDSRSRAPNESVMEYFTELSSLANGCNYGNTLEERLRDRFIFGINDEQIQSKLLAEAELTLHSALSIAATAEMANKTSRDFHNPKATATGLNVNKGTFKSCVRAHPYKGQTNCAQYHFKQERELASGQGANEPSAKKNRHKKKNQKMEKKQPGRSNGSHHVLGQQDSGELEAPFSVQSMGVRTIHNTGDVLIGPLNFHNVSIQ